MSTSRALHLAQKWMLCHCIVCAGIISLTLLPAVGQASSAKAEPCPETEEAANLQDIIALATSQVTIRDAEKSIAQAQVTLAEERTELLTAQVATAELAVNSGAKELRRLRRLPDQQSQEVREKVGAADAADESAKALLKEALARESVGRAEVALEKAKFRLTQKTLADAELRLSQLNARATAIKTSTPPN